MFNCIKIAKEQITTCNWLRLVSIVVNIIHIIIFSELPSHNGLSYYHILAHLSLADLSYSAMTLRVTTLNKNAILSWSFGGHLWYTSRF